MITALRVHPAYWLEQERLLRRTWLEHNRGTIDRLHALIEQAAHAVWPGSAETTWERDAAPCQDPFAALGARSGGEGCARERTPCT
ncbi:MAG TPA: hypothetical protein VM221_02705 [Armatimonadota bacterium]|nr:hypothetical protein [Armatimonadota bacterium]